jgi:hypothetical protein
MPEKYQIKENCKGESSSFWNLVRSLTPFLTVLLIFQFSARVACAAQEPEHISSLCDNAAIAASMTHGVPYDVLMAISRAETGRARNGRLHPWPWTVNMEGAGKWFADQDEARAYVFRHFKRGARSFDVGCFQVNYKWHGAAFRSIDDMFDPESNADYAAKFLMDLYKEFGDWTAAAGAYHSRTAVHATSYSARFEKIRESIEPFNIAAEGVTDQSNEDEFGSAGNLLSNQSRKPLMQNGTKRLGSLVPLIRRDEPATRAFVMLN